MSDQKSIGRKVLKVLGWLAGIFILAPLVFVVVFELVTKLDDDSPVVSIVERQKIIHMVKEHTSSTVSLGPNAGKRITIEDRKRAEDPGKSYTWRVDKRGENVYLVSYVTAGPEPGTVTGDFYEVDLENQTIKNLVTDRALGKRYGVRSPGIETIKVEDYSYELFEDVSYRTDWDGEHIKTDKGIKLPVRGTLLNQSNTPIVSIYIQGELLLKFDEDQEFSKRNLLMAKFEPSVDANTPWLPGEKRSFTLSFDNIGAVYREMVPMMTSVQLKAAVEDAFDKRTEGEVLSFSPDWTRLHNVEVNKVGKIKAKRFVNLRTEVAGERMQPIKKDVEVMVLVRRGKWLQISVGDKTGWLEEQFVVFPDDAPDTAPPPPTDSEN